MYTKYLVTGATGFLGRAVLNELHERTEKNTVIRALVLENDPFADGLSPKTETVCGDVAEDASLDAFFSGADAQTCVIHCAGIVSIASDPGERLYNVNVKGTSNIVSRCEKNGVGKLVYVSSVHAIPENPNGEKMAETTEFSSSLVHGDYAKSKAEATALVLAAAERGLNASVVQPSGIIGPGDERGGNITKLISAFLRGKLPLAVKGGYDFVDVRDVAHGVFLCSERGKRGKCYILSGHYATVREVLVTVRELAGLKRAVLCVPLKTAKMFAPVAEKLCLRFGRPPAFTPYAIAVLASNSNFSHGAATSELGYRPRSLRRTLADTLSWLKNKFPEKKAFRPQKVKRS